MEEQGQVASGETQEQVSDSHETKDNVSYDSYRKLLGEKKKAQSELMALREQVDSFKQEKMSSEGRKDEVIQSLRDQLNETKNVLKETKQTFAWNSVESQIKQAAIKAGCVAPDKLVRLMGQEELKALDINDNFQVNAEDLGALINKAKQEHQDIGLFGRKTVNVNDVQGVNKIKTKSINELTTDEIVARLKEL